jgi:hypothetical protein
MVRSKHGIDQLKILMCDSDDRLTTGVDRVSQNPLDAAKHGVDDEVRLESLLASNSSPGYHLKNILPCHLPSVERLIHLWARVELKSLPQLVKSAPLSGSLESELDVPPTSVILHQSKR